MNQTSPGVTDLVAYSADAWSALPLAATTRVRISKVMGGA
jgi:hypothetical protein